MNGYTSKEIHRFNDLFGETEAAYHEIALKLGVTDSAMKVLYAICEEGERCLLREICRRSGLSKQTVNSAIRKLEEEGVLYLESAGAKAKRACLTEKGKQMAERTALRVIEMENAIFASWPKAQVEQYLELTERFLNDLKRKAEEL